MSYKTVSAAALKSMLHDGGELALLDVREAGEFGQSHLLFATPAPYSRLELDIVPLVPRRGRRVQESIHSWHRLRQLVELCGAHFALYQPENCTCSALRLLGRYVQAAGQHID